MALWTLTAERCGKSKSREGGSCKDGHKAFEEHCELFPREAGPHVFHKRHHLTQAKHTQCLECGVVWMVGWV